jgi:dihydroxyacid dehydratase/phosphogluconate dehydratase
LERTWKDGPPSRENFKQGSKSYAHCLNLSNPPAIFGVFLVRPTQIAHLANRHASSRPINGVLFLRTCMTFQYLSIRILRGNLAPGGAVSKITGKEGLSFKGKARVFDNEAEFVHAIETKSIQKGEKTVVVLRYLGPKGGPGMPEMLKPTSLIMGAGLGMDVACLTDGRFSGG